MTLQIDGVFDIETESWDQFVLGGLMTAEGDYRSTRHELELVEWLLQMGGTIWTWNGGLFDTLWLAERIARLGLKAEGTTAGPRTTRLECQGLVVRDAFALCPMSLAKAARMAGIELTKETGLRCVCPKSCGGYCAIRKGMGDADYMALDRYLRLDCHASLRTLDAIVAAADRFDLTLAGTVGGASYKTCARIADVEKAEWAEVADFEAANRGRFGGRTEVIRPEAQAGWSYDINSAYPAALTRVALPTGTVRRCGVQGARDAFRKGREGIFVARVKVPKDMFLPLLPAHTPGGRTVFPVGTFVGAWTGLELRRALELGASADVHRALVWSDAEPVLAPALAHLWGCRAQAKREGNDSLAGWLKWFCNAPTGKLGESPEKERILLNPGDDEVRAHQPWCKRGRKKRCRCGAWRPLDREGRVWAAPFFRISDCAHLHWNAYLTSWTRIELHAQAVADGQDGRSSIYFDTDCVKAVSAREQSIGDELGEWGFEGRFSEWLALAPKVYRYRSEAGSWVVRGKGLPGLDYAGFQAFAAGQPWVVDRGVMPLRSAAKKGNLFQRKHLSRRSHADGRHYGGRLLRGDGLTYPQTYAESVQWEKRRSRSLQR